MHLLFYRAAGENHLRIFKLKKGKLKTVRTWDWYCSYHYPPHGMNKKAVYMINGKKVSRKKSNKVWNKYYTKSKELTYKKIK